MDMVAYMKGGMRYGEANINQGNFDTFPAPCSLEGLKGSKDGDKHEREPSKEQTP